MKKRKDEEVIQSNKTEKIPTFLILLHLMCAIKCAHASAYAASLMHVQNGMCHFCL